MAMTYVASSSNGAPTGSSDLVITKPTGTASGDVLLIAVSANQNTWTVPSGFTQLQTGDGSNPFRSYLYYKVAGGSEPSSYTFTKNTDTLSPLVGTMICIRGCNTVTPIDDSDVEVDTGGITASADPGVSMTVTRSTSPTRVLYWRTSRNTGSLDNTFSESSGGWDIGTQAVGGTGGTRYSSVVAYTGDFGSLGDTGQPTGGVTANRTTTDDIHFMVVLSGANPVDGTMAATLPSVSSDFAGTREIPTGSIASQLPSVSSQFAGTAAPPSGTVDATLPSLTSSFVGGQSHGSMGATLPSVTSALAGAVNPIGGFACQLPSLTLEFVGETRPFGEHIIRVEADHRSFRVVDDGSDVGLVPIKRSQVTDA